MLNNDEEAYDLLNSLETFMNKQNDESEILSISSDVSDDKNVEDATESFLQAVLTGNVKLLRKLYESCTKVYNKNRTCLPVNVRSRVVFILR